MTSTDGTEWAETFSGATIEAPSSLQATAQSQFLTQAWLAKGSITLPAAIFGFRAPLSRRIVVRLGLCQLDSLTWVSRLRWLVWLFRSTLTAGRRRREQA